VALAVVGCGGIAQAHLEAISRTPGARLARVFDLRRDAAEAAAAAFGGAVADDADACLADPEVGAVLVCTPPASHAELVGKALRAGRHVLCEKPFTLSLREARALRETARRAGRLALMAAKFRFVPDVVEARRRLREGEIGELVCAEVTFSAPVDMAKRWNADPAVSGGGVLWDNGPHAVDLLRFVGGPLRRIAAQRGPSLQELPVEDSVRLHAETASGALGTCDLSWSLARRTSTFLHLRGTRGEIEVGFGGSFAWDAESGRREDFGSGYDKKEAFALQMEHLVRRVRGEEVEPRIEEEDAVASVAAVEAAQASLRDGAFAPLSDESPGDG